MWHAWPRHAHATIHDSPILDDTRSAELISDAGHARILDVMAGYSPPTADAIVTMAVIRHRLLVDRIPVLHERGVRQLVVLGAGLDTTAFNPRANLEGWKVFEVDEPATQQWKRARLADLGRKLPPELIFAPCDFEVTGVLEALQAVGFDQTRPALVSLFGVIIYLTTDATTGLMRSLATLAPGSEVLLTYSPPYDDSDAIVREVWSRATPTVAAGGEPFMNFYDAPAIERLLRDCGFPATIHHPIDTLNKQYFADRRDGLHLSTVEQLLTGVC
ncbi:MAG: SAM-dependent methyltransferase [Actinobacteria bacterium]|nr:SAM-dependent methyltransferase [Actinomycetota bacterium]